uniref:F-box/LRR-repeat protein 15/At3g58940/PEG3-like LRR domain-containing protein n=1 Tax=Aegilops tauschii subsp. strangulata TaxID=200361 RepID=A0A453CJB6_AEGTS
IATQKFGAAEFEVTTDKAYKICSPADFLHFGKQFNDFVGACPDAFAGLTRLWLRNMRFGEFDIPNILSTCKLLESLRLSHCDSGIHSVLQVEHAQLAELEIDQGKFERVELICLPKLQRIWVLPECPKLLTPVLSKLQHVNLDHLPEGCDLAWTMFILEAAPSLKELCITLWDHWCIMTTDNEFRKKYGFCEKIDMKWKPYAPDFKHKNLAKLTIYGFQPDDNLLRYIRSVMEHAVNMAEISLHDRKVCVSCSDLDSEIKDKFCPSRYPRTAEKRKQTTEELGSLAMIHFRS